MSSLNQVTLVGNAGKDPEIRRMQNGDAIANLSVATSEKWTDKSSGEKKEKTEWHRVVIFGKVAEIVEKYVKKGTKLLVQGKLQTRKWTDKDGVERYSTEVVLSGFDTKMVLLSPANGSGSGSGPGNGTAGGNSGGAGQSSGFNRNDMEDEIPF